ncbi:GNAT family N-acetyltransferase [Aestuariivirga litoralis]|nr:GNAT family N-acetyltransferase [Aestuariivirga litoralis]
MAEHGALAVLKRAVRGSGHYDGVGPWPYLWVESPRDLEVLREGFRHLVTLTVVTQPGYVHPVQGGDTSFLKHHFVYDPALPAPVMSRRTRTRIARCEARATFRPITDVGRRMACLALYRRLLQRRGLTGCYVDFPDDHFQGLASLEAGVFFEVVDADGPGAFSCGVVFNGILQVLHMASSDEGLRWDASYLLMKGMQEHARSNRLRLMTGGMPDTGSPGLRQFKRKWANTHEPVYIMKIINDAALYHGLCNGVLRSSRYFPGYRATAGLAAMGGPDASLPGGPF